MSFQSVTMPIAICINVCPIWVIVSGGIAETTSTDVMPAAPVKRVESCCFMVC